MEIFHRILLVPQNIVMDPHNVMDFNTRIYKVRDFEFHVLDIQTLKRVDA